LTRERTIERACKRLAEDRGCLFLKFVSPGFAGVPDRILIRGDGSLAFVEMKSPTGKLSRLQAFVHDMLRRRKQEVYVVQSVDEMAAILGEKPNDSGAICTN
jgi:hypothetical protein